MSTWIFWLRTPNLLFRYQFQSTLPLKERDSGCECIYDLHAVISHAGVAKEGHYIAYCNSALDFNRPRVSSSDYKADQLFDIICNHYNSCKERRDPTIQRDVPFKKVHKGLCCSRCYYQLLMVLNPKRESLGFVAIFLCVKQYRAYRDLLRPVCALNWVLSLVDKIPDNSLVHEDLNYITNTLFSGTVSTIRRSRKRPWMM